MGARGARSSAGASTGSCRWRAIAPGGVLRVHGQRAARRPIRRAATWPAMLTLLLIGGAIVLARRPAKGDGAARPGRWRRASGPAGGPARGAVRRAGRARARGARGQVATRARRAAQAAGRPSSSRSTATWPRSTNSARHERRARPWRCGSQVGKIYGGRRALADVSAAVRAGARRRGAGPERRRQEHAARDPVDAGRAQRPARCAGATSGSAAARCCARRIGYVGHEPGLYGDLDGRARTWCCSPSSTASTAAPARARAMLGAGGPGRRAAATRRRARSRAACSSGWRWRARCCTSPALLLFDEPALGARSGGRRLAGSRARRRARRRPHRRAGDARSRRRRRGRRPGGGAAARARGVRRDPRRRLRRRGGARRSTRSATRA